MNAKHWLRKGLLWTSWVAFGVFVFVLGGLYAYRRDREASFFGDDGFLQNLLRNGVNYAVDVKALGGNR